LSAESAEEDVEGMLGRAEGLRDDAVSSKALDGAKVGTGIPNPVETPLTDCAEIPWHADLSNQHPPCLSRDPPARPDAASPALRGAAREHTTTAPGPHLRNHHPPTRSRQSRLGRAGQERAEGPQGPGRLRVDQEGAGEGAGGEEVCEEGHGGEIERGGEEDGGDGKVSANERCAREVTEAQRAQAHRAGRLTRNGLIERRRG
jgi:hypothetical protein